MAFWFSIAEADNKECRLIGPFDRSAIAKREQDMFSDSFWCSEAFAARTKSCALMSARKLYNAFERNTRALGMGQAKGGV
ncbi:hypothetical protein L4C33_18795 [Vibrio makurazakiensis]|uniref:hypothetical protein n=1 Tax=Vibrio makurazakiensis TaxID=2910250 RepID=UPI003D120EB8